MNRTEDEAEHPLGPGKPVSAEQCKLIIVLTTVAHRADAEKLSGHLIEHRLAACVQVEGPIQSQYFWDSNLQSEEEYRLVIKTMDSCWSALHDEVLRIHPYEEPQLIRVSADGASAGYHGWVLAQTQPQRG